MEVTDDLIDNLADLSRLKFNEAEKEEIKNDLQRMISFVDKLNEVDTTGVKALLHMTDEVNRYRDDVVHGSMKREDAMQNAPLTDGNYFKVPKVIKK